MIEAIKVFPFIFGVIMTINFLLFWAFPILGMGMIWKYGLKFVLLPIFNAIDSNKLLRMFAENFIYTNSKHADFFFTSVLVTFSTLSSLIIVFHWQFKNGYLPMWLIISYYCSWVGVGGRMMGAAYAMAHKEGHTLTLYKKWLRRITGNFFEDVLGVFYGNIPHNFSTSHISIHHKTNGGIGDTFYLWDLDRSSLFDFMLYVHRIFLHMIGYTSVKLFRLQKQKSREALLRTGQYKYLTVGLLILILTRSPAFVFWIYLQPLLCMSYFLALINVGFHGFLEYDESGARISVVDATTIIEGEDDYFGEDDHMAHHYQTNIYYRDLPALQKSKVDEFSKHHASVFRSLSVVELSIFILLNLWDKLAEHYVDYSGKLSQKEIAAMLHERATRKEMSYVDYETHILSPTNPADAVSAITRQSLDLSQNHRRKDDDDSDLVSGVLDTPNIPPAPMNQS